MRLLQIILSQRGSVSLGRLKYLSSHSSKELLSLFSSFGRSTTESIEIVGVLSAEVNALMERFVLLLTLKLISISYRINSSKQ